MNVIDFRSSGDTLPLAHGTLEAPVVEGYGVDLALGMAELGGEIAAPLTAALERVDLMLNTGRIDRAGLGALRADIDRARRAGIVGQQLSRLARGRIRQTTERIDLTSLLREAVEQRGSEIAARGVEVRQSLQAAEVLADSSLVFSLLQALLDWSLEQAQARIDLGVDIKTWPVHARVTCRFAHRAADVADIPASSADSRLDTMAWRLVEQTAHSIGLQVRREDSAGLTRLELVFPRTVSEPIPGVSVIELDSESAAIPTDSRTLAGSHVLVIAARRETRMLVRDAIRPMGLMVDFAGSVEEAREFCRGGLPHAVVYESALGGERFEQLRRELAAQASGLGFITISEQGREYESSTQLGRQLTRIGRDAVMPMLPTALSFVLTHSRAA